MSLRTLAVAAIVALGLARNAAAIEINHYFAGLPNIDDFFMPAPEQGRLIYGQYNLWYHTDTIRKSNGDKLDSITGPLGNKIDVDVDIDNFVIAPTVMWAPDFSILGARYGGYVLLPVGNPSLDADLETVFGRGRSKHGSTWGVGDILVQPLWLNWNRPRVDFSIAYAFDAPTGKFTAGEPDNVGLGFWEHQIQGAWRVHLDEAKTLSTVLVFTGEIPMNQQGEDIRPGTHLTINWGVRKNFLENWLQFAVLGYDTWQLSDDSGSDATSTARDQVHAAGFQIGIPKYGLALKYLHEFVARDRFEGQMVTLFFALPLDRLWQMAFGTAH